MKTTAPEKSPRIGGHSLTAMSYRAVSDMIRHRRLKGGEKVSEAKLAEALGISRTPLREALQRLEGEGLVRKGDGRNFIVRSVDIGEYLQSLRLRLLIEPEAAALALPVIPRLLLANIRAEVEQLGCTTAYHADAHWDSDDRLHGMILDHCGNAVMAKVLRDLRVTTRLYEIDKLSDRLQPDTREHIAILDALCEGSTEGVKAAVAAHVNSLIEFARRNLA